MSLILYYLNCFTADKRAVNIGTDTIFGDTVNKTYISEDKRFAGMSCGGIPTNEEWETIRDIIDLYRLEASDSKKQTLDKKLLSKTAAKISSVFIENIFDYNLLIVVEDLMLNYKVFNNYATLSHHNPNTNYIEGSGKYSAHVLINSGLAFDKNEFFTIVSQTEQTVSREYDCIELKDVIGTPWHKASMKDLNNVR